MLFLSFSIDLLIVVFVILSKCSIDVKLFLVSLLTEKLWVWKSY